MNFVECVLVKYRWVFVCFFLLPISLFYNVWNYFRSWLVFKLNSAPTQHEKKVKHVQDQILKWNDEGRRTQMCTARPGWQTMSFRRPLYKKFMTNIEVNLVDILEVDTQRRVVRVEPMVSMGQLTAALNPLGWTIPILPEIDDLTIGGLVMGTGIESSSHIYGLFQHVCVSYEIILCNGTIIKCSLEHEPDLFWSIPWSYGTLGILTAVEIQIIPAKNYVRLEYQPIWGTDNIVSKLTEASMDKTNEFVEMLVFSKNQAVLMTGVQTNNLESGKLNSIGRWYKPWFYKYVGRKLLSEETTTEYIPLRAYYHRHTRSLFWELQDIIPFGNNLLFRILFGWLVPPKVSLLKLTQTKATKKLYENHHIIQDMLIPVTKLKESLQLFKELVNVHPIWLCPFILPPTPGMVNAKNKKIELYVDIGLYGTPHVDHFKPLETTRQIEKFVIEAKGFQMLYADTYMTRDEFRIMFDHTLYDKLRLELNCLEAFPEVYDKVSKEARF